MITSMELNSPVKTPAHIKFDCTVHSTCIELWSIDFTVVLILFLTPNPSLSLYFETDKMIFGCVDANFGDINLLLIHWVL